jgi:hypothetical protein
MYMNKFKICGSRQWQFLPFLTGRTIILFTSILLFSESNVATAGQYPVSIAQMPQTNDTTLAAAELAYQEGKQLYQQGTAESLVKAIAKFEQALPLYHQLSSPSEAYTLSYIGRFAHFTNRVAK